MTVKLIKQMIDACRLGKRACDMMPPLPKDVLPSYIHVLDTAHTLEAASGPVRVSDISDALGLPRPGVTRTVKEMEAKGYLTKSASPDDGRVTYITAASCVISTIHSTFPSFYLPCRTSRRRMPPA